MTKVPTNMREPPSIGSPGTESPVIVAIGYSVRALVEVCASVGLQTIAVDHFGDADTRQFADGRWIKFELTETDTLAEATRADLQEIVDEFNQICREVFFLLAGGMENLGALVEQLRGIAPVLGPSEAQRKALRSITFLGKVARAAGLRFPNVRRDADRAPTLAARGQWLWKSFAGAGGLRVERGSGLEVHTDSGYWQEFIEGEQIGVCCLLGSDRCEVLGATYSFGADHWPGPTEFIYRGSCGPITLSSNAQQQVIALCNSIQTAMPYVGWLQFDFVEDTRGQLWLLECNPRWTAGMEVLWLSESVNSVSRHLQAWEKIKLAPSSSQNSTANFAAKAIVYAKDRIELSAAKIAKLQSIQLDAFRWLADVPFEPQVIEKGHPIVTVRKVTAKEGRSNRELQSEMLSLLKSSCHQLVDAINVGTVL